MGVSPCFNNVLLLNLPFWKAFYDCKKKKKWQTQSIWPSSLGFLTASTNQAQKTFFLIIYYVPLEGNMNQNWAVYRDYRWSWSRQCPQQRGTRGRITSQHCSAPWQQTSPEAFEPILLLLGCSSWHNLVLLQIAALWTLRLTPHHSWLRKTNILHAPNLRFR